MNYFHVMTTDDDKKTFKSRHHCRLSNCEYWLSWTNTVSEQKIPITILILKLGPCLILGWVYLGTSG